MMNEEWVGYHLGRSMLAGSAKQAAPRIFPISIMIADPFFNLYSYTF
jgi:hypothetical protein